MTTPFSDEFVDQLSKTTQGGKLYVYSEQVVFPKWFCCVSGTSVGVAKDPAAMLSVSPTRVCTDEEVTAYYGNSWSPSSTISSLGHFVLSSITKSSK